MWEYCVGCLTSIWWKAKAIFIVWQTSRQQPAPNRDLLCSADAWIYSEKSESLFREDSTMTSDKWPYNIWQKSHTVIRFENPSGHSVGHWPHWGYWDWFNIVERKLKIAPKSQKQSILLSVFRAWFRSRDLRVMGPPRFHCATLNLGTIPQNCSYYRYYTFLCSWSIVLLSCPRYCQANSCS